MKSILWSLLATVIGVGMVAGGVYGIAKGGDSKDKTTTSSASPFPISVSQSPASVDQCAAVARRDPRLPGLDKASFQATGGETGSAEADLICNGDTVVLIMHMSRLKAKDITIYNAWLTGGGARPEQVGTLTGSGGSGFGSITITPDVDTARYDSLVITRVKFGDTETRPRRIVFRLAL